MNSKTALEIVDAARGLVESGQASREELERYIFRLSDLIELAVEAILVQQLDAQKNSEMIRQDTALIKKAADTILHQQKLINSFESLKNSTNIQFPIKQDMESFKKEVAAISPQKTLPRRDEKGRFIRFNKSQSSNNQCDSCVCKSSCKSATK